MGKLPAFLRGRVARVTKPHPTAIEAIREEAAKGDPGAMLALARAFEEGSAVLQDFTEAVHWYERAAEKGFIPACAALGEIFLVGRGARSVSDGPITGVASVASALSVSVDYEKAARWNGIAGEAGNVPALTRLAAQHAYGLGIDQNWMEARRLFLLAAEQGDPVAQRGLGVLHAGEELGEADYGQAAYWLRQSASQGDPTASAALAFLIGHGHVDPSNEAELLNSLTDAAEAGHLEAMAALGTLYRRGLGVTRDLSVAETWYRRASIRGHLGATLALGFLLIEDLASPDYFSAALVFREATERGNAIARYMLGMFHTNGLGVPQDRDKAEELLTLAANEGLSPALEALANLKLQAAGPQDISEGIALLDRAAASGNVEALYRRAHLALSGVGQGGLESTAAVAMLEEAAERGNPAAALEMGILNAKGELLEQNHVEAARWYGIAAERGLTDGSVNLAFLHLTGMGAAKDAHAGIEMLKAAAERGNHNAIWALYNLFNEGSYIAADPSEALHWLIVATQHGSGIAAGRLLVRWEAGDAPGVSENDLVDYLRGAADSGDPEAEAVYGRLLYEGRHLKQDLGEAFRRLNSAAHKGNVFAQAWMGDVLLKGEIVLKDEALAREWYGKAARNGHVGAALALTRDVMGSDPTDTDKADLFGLWLPLAEAGEITAQRMVGDFFLQGCGVNASDDEAARWLRAAADKNQLGALLLLGGMLISGRARPQSPDEPVRLFERAAIQGSAEAKFNLGVCFGRGIGVQQDAEQARIHFQKAADGGYEPAKAALQELAAQMQ